MTTILTERYKITTTLIRAVSVLVVVIGLAWNGSGYYHDIMDGQRLILVKIDSINIVRGYQQRMVDNRQDSSQAVIRDQVRRLTAKVGE